MEEMKVKVVRLVDTKEIKSCVLTNDENVKDGIRDYVVGLSKDGAKRTFMFDGDIYMDIYYMKERNMFGCYVMDTEQVRHLEFNVFDDAPSRGELHKEIRMFKNDMLINYLSAVLYDNEIGGSILFYIIKNIYDKGLGDIYTIYNIIKNFDYVKM